MIGFCCWGDGSDCIFGVECLLFWYEIDGFLWFEWIDCVGFMEVFLFLLVIMKGFFGSGGRVFCDFVE